MSPQTLADDLAYIRDLAEAGQKAPLLGGRFLAWWGGLTTLAYLGHYAIAEGMWGLQPVMFSVMWTAYIILGLAGSFYMQINFPREKPGAASTGNRVSALVWQAAACMLGAYFLGAILAALMSGNFGAFLWSVPIVIGLYGLSQFVSGTISDCQPLKLAGLAAMLGMVPAVMLTGTNFAWLVGTAVAALCVFVPGIILMRNEPSSTV